jgi:hypothetical protein
LQALSKRSRHRQRNVQEFWEELDLAASAAWPGWRSLAELSAVVSEIPSASIAEPASLEPASVTLSTINTEAWIRPPVYRPKKRIRFWMVLTMALLGGALAAGVILAIRLV